MYRNVRPPTGFCSGDGPDLLLVTPPDRLRAPVRRQLTSVTVTSNTRIEFAGIGPLPRLPYPRFGGMMI